MGPKTEGNHVILPKRSKVSWGQKKSKTVRPWGRTVLKPGVVTTPKLSRKVKKRTKKTNLGEETAAKREGGEGA